MRLRAAACEDTVVRYEIESSGDDAAREGCRAVVAGLGTASPGREIDAAAGCELALRVTPGHDAGIVRALYSSCGVTSRGACVDAAEISRWAAEHDGRGPSSAARFARYSSLAGPMACDAALAALRDAGCEAGAVTHVVTVSCTGAESPGLDRVLIERLGLRRGVTRAHVGFMGCHGAMNGLAVADAFARSTPGAVVLLVCCEVCSLHYQAGVVPWDQMVANAIFADGASAAVIAGPAATRLGVLRGGLSGTGMELEIGAFSSWLFADTDGAMGWTLGDHGFCMRLSPRVPAMLRREVSGWLGSGSGFGSGSGSGFGSGRDADASSRVLRYRWAVHPGGRDVLEAVRRGLGLDEGSMRASAGVLAERGNMSSGTVLAVLRAMLNDASVGGSRSDRDAGVVLLAFGPGLVGEAAVLTPRLRVESDRARV